MENREISREFPGREIPGTNSNPDAFAPGFGERLQVGKLNFKEMFGTASEFLQDLMDGLRKMEPTDPKLPVLVPGDPERQALQRVKEKGAILYTENHITTYRNLAEKLNVEPMRHLRAK